MAGNKNLNAAARAKKDEFYTQLADIEREMVHYRHHFRGKRVLCNCDDPFESNFFKYFALNFRALDLERLVCTCYDGSPITGKELDLFGEAPAPGARSRVAYKAVITREEAYMKEGKAYCLDDVGAFLKRNPPARLAGHGDFRGAECVKLLEEADVVVTNPPFSLLREFLALLVAKGKDFLIIGNQNSLTCRDVFPLVRDGRLWQGPSITSGDRKFHVPDDYPLDAATCGVDPDGRKFIRVKSVRWFTNLDHGRRHLPMDLVRRYDPVAYPRYDNYDAIHVAKTQDIPVDWDGVMGVPFSFMDRFCPEQFAIVGMTDNIPPNAALYIPGQSRYDRAYLGGKRQYPRLFIHRKEAGA